MAILLIGSTGSGKSTLGNFLIDPENSSSNLTFAVATDNKPMTQFTEIATVPVSATRDIEDVTNENTLVVIDTPGLNESKSKDFSHMTKLIKQLNIVKMIKACIFVVKFSAKIDQQYKDTIRYYSQLLPSLFSRNVLIVMTDYATDKRSEAIRKTQGMNVTLVMKNIKQEIVATANMAYTPDLIEIDCLPFDGEEKLVSLEARKKILSYVLAQQGVMVKNLRVAKTKAIKEDDERKVRELKGKIDGYSFRLEEANIKASAALKETKESQEKISNIERDLISPRQHLEELNSGDEVVSISSSTDHDSKGWLTYLYTNFDLESMWDISSVKWWKFHRHNKWKGCSQEGRRVRAKLEGAYGGGLHGSIMIYTRKKWMHEADIAELREEISRKELDLAGAKKEAEYSRKKHEEHGEACDTLKNFIEKTKKEIEKIGGDTMTICEAQCRIGELL